MVHARRLEDHDRDLVPVRRRRHPPSRETLRKGASLEFGLPQLGGLCEGWSMAKAKKKNPHAVALGRLGGLKGGPARAEKLSAKRRSEIARKAVKARWARTKSKS